MHAFLQYITQDILQDQNGPFSFMQNVTVFETLKLKNSRISKLFLISISDACFCFIKDALLKVHT